MSTLADLAAGALRPARESLGHQGADSLSIDAGPGWLVTRAEAAHSRDFDIGGQKVEVDLLVVGESAEFQAVYSALPAEYLGKAATVGGRAYRVASINEGEIFTEIALAGPQESP